MRRVLLGGFCLTLALLALADLFRSPDLNLPSPLGTLRQEADLADRFDDEIQASLRRSAAKTEVAQEVAAGRLTLFEAAARYRDLDAGVSEAYRRGWLHLAEGGSDEERYCRQVLGYVALGLRDRPGEAPTVLDRLEAQLDEALARGALHLPGQVPAPRPPDPRPPAGGAAAGPDPARSLPLYAGPPPGRGQCVQAYTDRGRPVVLEAYPDRPAPSPELAAAEGRWLIASGLEALLLRTGPATEAYVCHDWVFTGGRYSLVGASVDDILQDNGYHEVAVPQAGDLAVYRDGVAGPVMHTGVVRWAGGHGVVLVESKWAWMGRYLHPAGVYCYPGAVCTFYRSPRPGHLLHGAGNPEPATREPGGGRPATAPA